MSEFSVSLAKLAEEANLTIAYTPCELDKIQVTATEVYRPGILLAGYYENFDSKRIQIIGLTEMSYLDELSTSLRNTHLEKLFSFQPPAIVLTRGMQPLSEMMQFAKQYGVPILMSTEMTSALMGQLITTLNTELAPRITRHGVLVEVYGEGILILGDSGVGKSETAVHSMVDFFLLIQLAGTGDELQGIKRGIMEMADGIIINKADGDNIDKANLAAAQFRNALHLFPPSESGWFPKVLTYSGYYNIGIKEIWDMVGEYMEFTKKNGYFDYKRNEQAKYWMYESINDTLRDKFYHNPAVEGMLEQTEKQVLNNEISSFVAAKRMIDLFLDNIATK